MQRYTVVLSALPHNATSHILVIMLMILLVITNVEPLFNLSDMSHSVIALAMIFSYPLC